MTEEGENEYRAIIRRIREYPYLDEGLTEEYHFGILIMAEGGVTTGDFEAALEWWVKTPYEVHDDLKSIRSTALNIASKRMLNIADHKRKRKVE